MKFIEFEGLDGRKEYINPAFVVSVSEDESHEGYSVVSMRGEIRRVKGSPVEVCQKLVRGYSV